MPGTGLFAGLRSLGLINTGCVKKFSDMCISNIFRHSTLLEMRLCVQVGLIVGLLAAGQICLFEVFGNHENRSVKEAQFLRITEPVFLGVPFLDWVARHFHVRTPLLVDAPYLNGSTDGRGSSWNLPPHQVILDWVCYTTLSVFFLVRGAPKVEFEKSKIHRKPFFPKRVAIQTLLLICLATFLFTVFCKLRAGLQLGEWFNVVYLLQPCHVLVFGYCVLSSWLLRDRGVPSPRTSTLMHALFDFQGFTWCAILVPDISDLLRRDFRGELFLFWFEHVLLAVIPYIYVYLFFAEDASPPSLRRVLFGYGACILIHAQALLPLSFVSGTQVNYQTHLPRFAMGMGRWYKMIISGLYLGLALFFCFIVEPLFRRLVFGKRKFVKIL